MEFEGRVGDRLRLTILTGQTPHLIPFARDLPNLLGGLYEVQRGGDAASFVNLPLAPADSFGARAGGAAAIAPLARPAAKKRGKCARKRGARKRKRVLRRRKCMKRKRHPRR